MRVYPVNEGMSALPTLPYRPEEWYRFVLVLLNPAGSAQRDDLTQAALGAGESMAIDFRTLYALERAGADHGDGDEPHDRVRRGTRREGISAVVERPPGT